MSAQRTFWHLEGKRRVPSQYELKSARLLYYPERGFAVKTPISAWFERYQTGTPLALESLADFRDPRETTYASYVALAREKEAFIDGLLRSASDSGYDARLDAAWLDSLERWLGVLLYPCHGLHMLTAYVAHLAPVSEVVIALAFQCGDEIRRIQRFAQRVAILRQTRPEFAAHARQAWQDAPEWQPLRRVIEELLVTYDFGEALVRLLLVVKPAFDAFFVDHAGRVAEARQDPLLCRLLFSLQEDTRWHETVADTLARGLVQHSDANRELVAGWVRETYPAMRAALAPLEPLLDPSLSILNALDTQLGKRWQDLGLDLKGSSVTAFAEATPAPIPSALESETRFRTMADHAPVLLWMAGTDGLCNFFNQRWLDFTGRTLEQEIGSGWAGGVHPEDFQRCMSIYLDSFVARKSFSMEYRLRRNDGAYRWVYDQGAPRFEQDGSFAGFIGSCTDVTEQRLARDALGQLTIELEDRVRERTAIAHEREVLLREVHHRVKNDLQLISSLLSMQARRLADPDSVVALTECQSRVQTIALIHEYMYQSENLARMPLSRNIRGLAANLLRGVGPSDRGIRLEVEVEEDLELPVDRAIPCGLILNELMTNALKHAFPEGRPGTLSVTLRKEGPDRVALAVSDDGVGLPDAHDDGKNGSLGWRLVKAFGEQLGAEIRVSSSTGTKVEVVFRAEG